MMDAGLNSIPRPNQSMCLTHGGPDDGCGTEFDSTSESICLDAGLNSIHRPNQSMCLTHGGPDDGCGTESDSSPESINVMERYV